MDIMNEGKRSEALKEVVKNMILVSGDHACRDNPDLICPVTSAVSDDLMFVKKPEKECPYYVPFGYAGFCNFNPRKELYKNYNI
jgi:hypothetical protein